MARPFLLAGLVKGFHRVDSAVPHIPTATCEPSDISRPTAHWSPIRPSYQAELSLPLGGTPHAPPQKTLPFPLSVFRVVCVKSPIFFAITPFLGCFQAQVVINEFRRDQACHTGPRNCLEHYSVHQA
jgi:hypothetical protein